MHGTQDLPRTFAIEFQVDKAKNVPFQNQAVLERHYQQSRTSRPSPPTCCSLRLHVPSIFPPPCNKIILIDTSSNISKMPSSNLVEIDSLEALVIIDNELDPLSPAAPDTVHVSGLMSSLATGSPHDLKDRGDAEKELRMEDICCSAHGLSILVVSRLSLTDNVPRAMLMTRRPRRRVT